MPVPDGLAPGEAVEVRLPGIPLPDKAGAWLLKLDVDLPGFSGRLLQAEAHQVAFLRFD
mgnify:CR=1 FL=1